MSLLIGCPVWKRSWVLHHWFLFVEEACLAADVVPAYAFVLDTRDNESDDLISKTCADRGRELHIVHVNEDGVHPDGRNWDEARLRHMVWVRNELLVKVRELAPDLFFSLDSDILLHEDALVNLLESVERFDAVGTKCYLSWPDRSCPNYAGLINGSGLMRPDASEVFTTDVIMAAKLMRPAAYALDYRYHYLGEDIGISQAWAEQHLRVGWDGRACSKHVMDPSHLNLLDQRCGY